MAEVVVELGGKEVLRIPLKGPTMIIGRDPQCDLHLDNRALSRRHAQIEKRGAAIWVRDLNSQNGTYVNGSRIAEPQALNGGDVVEVGRYHVRIEGVEEARVDTPVLTLTGPEGRHRFAMVGEEIIIGRAPSCDIAIGHKSISRRHLRIAVDGNTFVAEDLGSQNGTRLNNKRINGPTPFKIGDKLAMSEFSLEVGYLDQPSSSGNGTEQKVSKTMMIDRSELAKAAYMGGDRDFDKMPSNAANVSVGQMQDDGDDEESGTQGVPANEPTEGPKLSGGASGRSEKRPAPAPAADNKKPSGRAQNNPWITLQHADHPTERDVQLTHEVTVVGEDGSVEDNTKGRSIASQGYLVLVKMQAGVAACVAGDRRLLIVNGKPCLTKVLNNGDTLELGIMSVVFHLPG